MTERALGLSLVVLIGWPLSGKSSIAERLAKSLNIRHLDINENVRVPIFGLPQGSPEQYEEFRQRDVEEMAASYELLLHAADIYLRVRRSIILTATFSRRSYQERLANVCARHREGRVRVVWCQPGDDTTEEVEQRLAAREREVELTVARGERPYIDPSNSMERYREVKARFEQPELPHAKVETWPRYTVDESAKQALNFILSAGGGEVLSWRSGKSGE